MSKREGKKILADAEKAGAQYAQDQITGDYFMQWVWDQMIEAEQMRKADPSSVIPLETKKDYRKVARNMLQQLEWDTKRDLHSWDLLNAAGASGVFKAGSEDWVRDKYGVTMGDVADAFYTGFDGVLEDDATREWLADEVEAIHGQLKNGEGGEISEARRGDAWNEDMRRALGTVGHNRHFTARELTEYLGGSADVRRHLQALTRAGYVGLDADGYFVTQLGWNWIEGGEVGEARPGRGPANPKLPRRHEDELVTDKALLPSALSARYIRDLKRLGVEAQLVDSITTMPRGWTHGNITTVKVGDESYEFKINVAPGEVSGLVSKGAGVGHVIGQARASDANSVIAQLVSDAVHEMRPSGVGEVAAAIHWEPSGGGTGWRGTGPSGRTYLLRRAGGGKWNLHIDGRQSGPFAHLDWAKAEAERHERAGTNGGVDPYTWAEARHGVRDYIAVDHAGRRVAGPFKDYGEAKREADRAGGYVKWSSREDPRDVGYDPDSGAGPRGFPKLRRLNPPSRESRRVARRRR